MKAVVFDLGHTLIDYYSNWEAPELQAIERSYRLAMENGCEAEPEKFQADLKKMLVEGRARKEKELVEIPLYQVLDTIFQRFGCDVTDEMLVEGMDIFYGVLVEDRKSGARDHRDAGNGEGQRVTPSAWCRTSPGVCLPIIPRGTWTSSISGLF